MRRPLALLFAIVCVLVPMITGCQSSGRDLRAPEPGATAPPRRAPQAGTRPSSTTTLATVFAVTTDAWTAGGDIPEEYTCDGANVSPPLLLSKIPAGAVELAVVMTDADANDYVHWVIAGIDPSTTFLDTGVLMPGAAQATAGNGFVGYTGPCPPEGDGSHTYNVTLYALASPSGVVDGQDAPSAIAAIEGASVARSQLTGTYER